MGLPAFLGESSLTVQCFFYLPGKDVPLVLELRKCPIEMGLTVLTAHHPRHIFATAAPLVCLLRRHRHGCQCQQCQTSYSCADYCLSAFSHAHFLLSFILSR